MTQSVMTLTLKYCLTVSFGSVFAENGIYFINEPAGQANFVYNNFDGNVRDAVDAGFDSIYIGNYNYQLESPIGDVLQNWVDLGTSKQRNTVDYAHARNAKIFMLGIGIPSYFLTESAFDAAMSMASKAKELKLDGVILDLVANEASYPSITNRDDYQQYVLDASQEICKSGLPVRHIAKNVYLADWMFEPNLPVNFPTVYAETVKSLEGCVDLVHLDYYKELQPSFQTDKTTIFENTTGLVYAGLENYGGSSISEIAANNEINSGILSIAKPLPYLGQTSPSDLACWALGFNSSGFVTWPYVTQGQQITAINWARIIKDQCGTNTDPTNAASLSTPSFVRFMTSILVTAASRIS